jgi:peptidoglycan/LPS O-acetylase OafA/YrhL
MDKHRNSAVQRLQQVDALRGFAALAVVLFHFTTRFTELYRPGQTLSVAFPHGHLGVNLFFIISGFVVFMTLERTVRPMDFVVSRFSRLFPSYWAAIALTFMVTHWLGLPGKMVDLGPALANFFMMHSIFGVPHVDGVYWTLEVEMLFYIGMFTLFRLLWLDRIHWVLLAFLSLRLLYVAMAGIFGIDLPWIAFRLLILQYIPWFALGICIYQITLQKRCLTNGQPLLTAATAVVTLAIAESALVGGLALVFAALVYAAALGRLRWLNTRLFLWLGSISYPFYLIHENIGWSIQLQALACGVPSDLTVLLVMAVSLALATAMTRWIEKPAMRWIRGRYQARTHAVCVARSAP